MDVNKVNVKIYGQEYVIAGEKSREHIIRVADYVDTKMKEIARSVSTPAVSAVAVLTAVNAADEYFSLADGDAELKKTNAALQKDMEHYIQLWEEAKKNFLQYKEDSKNALQKIEDLRKELAEKDKTIEEVQKKARTLEEKLLSASDERAETENLKFKELESTCFDLEMENVKLKAELERLKKESL